MSPANETPEACCEHSRADHHKVYAGCARCDCLSLDGTPVQPPAPDRDETWHGGPTGFAPKPDWWDEFMVFVSDQDETCGSCGHDAHTTALCTAQVHPCCDCGEDDGTLGPDPAAPDPPATMCGAQPWNEASVDDQIRCRLVRGHDGSHEFPPATTGGTDEAEGLAALTRVVLRQRLIDRNLPTEGRGYMEDERALAACEPVARAVLEWLRERDLARDARTRADALYAARDALYRGEGPDQYEGSDVLYGEWLGNRGDRIGGAS